MIGYIEGVILQTWDTSCLVLTSGGVAYRLILPSHSLSLLPAPGIHVAFYTFMAVREDAIELYGFNTFEERQTFEILKSINKVGPRTALSILSLFRPQELHDIVAEDNLAALTKVSGIGNKTAQHILLELRYKMGAIPRHTHALPRGETSGLFPDILAALLNLGYAEEECAQVIRSILKNEPDLDLSAGIRMALKELAQKK